MIFAKKPEAYQKCQNLEFLIKKRVSEQLSGASSVCFYFSFRGKNKKHLLRIFRNGLLRDKEYHQGAFMKNVQSWMSKFLETLNVLYQKNDKFKHQLDRIPRSIRQLVGGKSFCSASRNKEAMLALILHHISHV